MEMWAKMLGDVARTRGNARSEQFIPANGKQHLGS
jgi:hypothetical protein